MNYYGYEVIRESDISHHGIKGQRWGIRRFQKEDGSLTPAGIKRYGDDYESRTAAIKDPAYKTAEEHWKEGKNPRGLIGAYETWDRKFTPKTTTYNYESVSSRNEDIKRELSNRKSQLGPGHKPGGEILSTRTLNPSYGLGYRDPHYLNGRSMTLPDEAWEFLTGNIHENDIATIENQMNRLMDVEKFDIQDGVFTEELVRDLEMMDKILADYQDHTLPGLAKKTWNRGKARVTSLFSKIGSHFIKR